MRLVYSDHRQDPAAWAVALGISREAVELYLASDVIDLHVESYSWARVCGYDLRKRHGRGMFGARYYSQVDLPRLREAQVSGAMWSITANPMGTPGSRLAGFRHGLAGLCDVLASVPEDVQVVRTVAEYRAARAAGRHAAFLAVQGGNCFERDASALDAATDDLIVRITLLHMSASRLGQTSSPLRVGWLAGQREEGLSEFGRDFVKALNARRIFVDLAHINRAGFFDALQVHDPSLPAIVTHTGVDGVNPCWRNLDDAQLRAIADTGGVIGVVFHSWYLGDRYFFGGGADRVIDHLAHIIETVGEDFAALGSDFDGGIVTPRDMPTCLELPRLVQLMLDRGWSDGRIQKVLGGNFLRTLTQLRG